MNGINVLYLAASQDLVSQFGLPVVMIGVFVIFYFLMIRPERKKQKEAEKKRKEMLENMRKGDKILTKAYIYGTIVSVKDKTVIVKVDDNTKLEFHKEGIHEVIDRKDEETDAVKSNETNSDKEKDDKNK